jgi:hypothetical protein
MTRAVHDPVHDHVHLNDYVNVHVDVDVAVDVDVDGFGCGYAAPGESLAHFNYPVMTDVFEGS